jgi:ligand-binding sensor domain-containing protein
VITGDGTIWTTDDSSFYRFDGERWHSPAGLEDLDLGIVWSMVTGADGTLWVGSENGLSHFDGSRWAHFPLNKKLFPGSGAVNAEGVMALAVAPDGMVWVATQRGVASFRLAE